MSYPKTVTDRRLRMAYSGKRRTGDRECLHSEMETDRRQRTDYSENDGKGEQTENGLFREGKGQETEDGLFLEGKGQETANGLFLEGKGQETENGLFWEGKEQET